MTTQILLSAKSGNSSAMSDLLVNTQRSAAAVCYGLLGNRWKRFIDTEDMTQEVMIQIHNKLHLCTAESWDDYLKWVSIVSRNVVYHELVKMKSVKRGMDKLDSLPEGFEVAQAEETPDDEAIKNEEMQILMTTAAAGKGPVVKKVVRLLMDGLTQEQVVAELHREGVNITRNAISGYLFRLKQSVSA